MSYRLSADLLETYVPLTRKYLATAAAKNRLVTYMEIANQYGGRGYFGQVLDELNRREQKRGGPLISAIVVDAETRRPSEGFFQLARELGLLRGTADRWAFWEQERDRVWAHGWTG